MCVLSVCQEERCDDIVYPISYFVVHNQPTTLLAPVQLVGNSSIV